MRAHIWLSSACAALALAACGRGADAPPADFGPVAGTLFGCPSVEGVYAWPPVAGAYSSGKYPTNRPPWEDGKPVPIHGSAMQIWVKEKGGSALWFRARTVNPAIAAGTPVSGGWSFAEYHRGQWVCKESMFEMASEEIGPQSNFGGTGARRSFRLARLKDGGLAVGIRTVAHGGKDALWSYEGHTLGEYDAPDRQFWSWSKLARTGPGDREPGSAGAP